jgi:2'-5' RNA ligase
MRVFTAVEIPQEVRDRLAATARELTTGVRSAKPVARENLHVTIRFLGEVRDADVPAIAAAVRQAVGNVPSGAVELRGLGAFPDLRRPSVVWAGVDDPSASLARLEAAVSARLAELDFPAEDRPFSAHVTLARVRARNARRSGVLHPLVARIEAARSPPPHWGRVPVDSITLFSSDLGGEAARHTPLGRFPLSNHVPEP